MAQSKPQIESFTPKATMSRQRICQTLCAFTAVRRASRCITQLYDLVLSPTGLRASQFSIMLAIEQAGEMAQCRISEEYGIAVETLSRRLGSLRKKGLVEVREGPVHHERVYHLTPAGQVKLNEAMPYWNRAQERLRATLGNADWGLLFVVVDLVSVGSHAAQLARVRNFPLPAADPLSVRPDLCEGSSQRTHGNRVRIVELGTS